MASGDRLVVSPEHLDEDRDPPTLVARDDELRDVLDALRCAAPRNGHVWIHGPVGSGRTALARHAASRLEGAAVAHVDCRTTRTAYLVLDHLVASLRLLGLDQRRECRARLETLRAGLGGRRVVVVLDDIDALPVGEFHDLLAALTSLDSVSIIGTARDTTPLLAEVEHPQPCLFLPRIVALDALPTLVLRESLLRRADAAFRTNACPPEALDAVAHAASGDLRLAVRTLRRAAFRADARGAASLALEDVHAAIAELRESRRAAALGRMTPHHRALLDAVQHEPGATAAAVRAAYVATLAQEGRAPVAERTLRKYLNADLPALGLVRLERTGLGGNVVRYWPVNGTPEQPEPQR